MPNIRRNEMLAGLTAVRTIQSVTWRRRRDKIVKRCVNCEAETATHRGDRFCNGCNEFVGTYDSTEAAAGDVVRMQFIPRINPDGTKNWTPAGGFIFNAKSRAEAEAIKRRKGLFQCLKMGEQMPDDAEANEVAALVHSGDLRALPRCFGVNDVETWTAEGQTYTVVD
jgi:hypothetical protein